MAPVGGPRQTPGMADIALFHSSLGLRPGVTQAAERLRAAGHTVLAVDQYGGRVFDDPEAASAFAAGVGYPELMRRALTAVEGLADGFVAAGFSNGGGMAEYVATQRACGGVLMLSGALPLAMLGASSWPAGVPAQIHYTVGDRFRRQEGIDAVVGAVRAAGGQVETFDYPGSGHLFTDPTLPAEYDEQSAELLWSRILAFLAAVDQLSRRTGDGP